jgi:AraC-like DNA-binding protein
LCFFTHLRDVLQFQYNPEWFQDEEDGDASDDWDLNKYRREQEEDNLAAEELRIAQLALQSGYHEEVGESSAGGGSSNNPF